MTHTAPRRRGGKTWILPAAAVTVVMVAGAVGALSRSLILDALAWWPVWLLLAAIAFWGRALKVGTLRLPGLVSVSTVLVLGVFVFGHIRGWDFMPSAAGRLVGSADQPFATAALSARVPEGSLEVRVGSVGPLYDVDPIRWGGTVPLPTSVERSQEDSVSIELMPEEDPGWFRWAGWSLDLSPTPVWALTLEGELDADLRGLSVDNLQVIGSGSVVVGGVSMSTPLTVAGDFVIDVPAGIPVRVIGPAQIPDGWVRTETGAASPASGQGWVISIAEGAVVQIRNQ